MLAHHRGDGGTGYAHGGNGPEAEDEYGVQHNIGHRAGQLEDHGPDHVAGGLQCFFKIALDEHRHGAHTADGQIRSPSGVDRTAGLGIQPDKPAREEQAEYQEQHPGAHPQKNPMGGRRIRFLLIALAQAAGNQGVNPHTGAHGERNKQQLHRIRQRNGCQRVLADLRNKITVHHIVQCLYQHGKHRRQRHGYNQGKHPGCTHFILCCLHKSNLLTVLTI